MKEFIQTASAVSVFLFYWQYDHDTYTPNSMYNMVLFASSVVFTLTFGILEIREKKSDKKQWTLWLSLLIIPALILVLSQEMIINVYSITVLSLFCIVDIIPLVKHIIRKNRKS